MAQYRVVLLPGDGIGPEITTVARQLLDVVAKRHGFELTFEEQPIGGSAIDATGEPLPASTLNACRSADAVLLAAIGSPRFDSLPREKRPETGLAWSAIRSRAVRQSEAGEDRPGFDWCEQPQAGGD